jgi:tRNA(Ile)-lysidine synthase
VRNPLLKIVINFLKLRLVPNRPLLLGYSGGPDSEALLQLLLECQGFVDFELHLAHIDHGWREESRNEAEELDKKAKSLSLPFFLKRLTSADFKKNNLEEDARNARIEFFYALHEKYNYQALLLGHQADDHAESVLKRVFEGAHFSKLCALFEVTKWQNMSVWRPLIGVRKRELVSYLKRRNIPFFTDPTNQSERFLRGKLRAQLLPFLAQHFGKEITDNLCFLGRESGKLRDYFERKMAPHLEKRQTFAFGSFLNLPVKCEEIELQFLLKEWFTQERCSVSREILEEIIHSKSEELVFVLKGKWVYRSCNRLFILNQPPSFLKEILNKL